MKVSHQIVFWGILLCSMIVSSCVQEPEFDQNDIYGDWEVIAAKRNNRLTSTLKDGYFKFHENGNLETNIFGSKESYTISIENDIIKQDDKKQTEYKIRMLQNDTLHMSATIQKYYFDFLAVKRDSLQVTSSID